MVVVAVLVCLFAVGMAALLDFFKYRANDERIMKERLLVIGDGIERSIQQSLALGLQFADLKELPATLKREADVDDFSLDIEVFDTEGHPLYHAETNRPPREMPAAWLAAARRAGKGNFFVEDGTNSVAGISLENNFDLQIGYLGISYDIARVRATESKVALQLAGVAALVFAVSAALASLAMFWVMKRLNQQVSTVEAALNAKEGTPLSAEVKRGPFGAALARFFETVRQAEAQIAELRSHLVKGAPR
jgi:hypothetical protein